MSLEVDLAQFVTNTRYEDFPQHIVEIAKMDILDSLGVALAGSGAAGCKEIVQLLTDLEAGGKCNILVYGNRVPPHSAALANATMAHALDFDDDYEPGTPHVGITVVPAALAISQYLGGVSGKDFISAIILGIDVICRMCLATNHYGRPRLGWMYTPLYGYFSVAATVGRLLGLNEDGILNAFGITYAQAAGNLECISGGALTKRVQAGFAASGGLLSALMASRGITGAKNSMEGKYGIFNVYIRGTYDGNMITADLGRKFELENLSFKPYPCGRNSHSAIDAALKLVETHNILSEEIEEVIVEVTPMAHETTCMPPEIKQKPRTIVDAQFSTPYVVATALVNRRVAIEDFTEDAIKDENVLRITRKLRTEPSLELMQNSGTIGLETPAWPARLTVKAGGRVYSASVDYAKGHPQNPMTDEELESKFRYCASHAVKPLSPSSVEKVINIVRKLDEVDNVTEIIGLLV